eukprot:2929333-Ditylum_brightwellii.AAC.1
MNTYNNNVITQYSNSQHSDTTTTTATTSEQTTESTTSNIPLQSQYSVPSSESSIADSCQGQSSLAALDLNYLDNIIPLFLDPERFDDYDPDEFNLE